MNTPIMDGSHGTAQVPIGEAIYWFIKKKVVQATAFFFIKTIAVINIGPACSTSHLAG
jgi:hypothetical protein